MKIIIGTKFTAKNTGMEYTVFKRSVMNDGSVMVDFIDKTSKVYQNTPESVLLSKLESGDIINLKLTDLRSFKPSYEFFKEGYSIVTKID